MKMRLVGATHYGVVLGGKPVAFKRGVPQSVHPRYVPILLKYQTVSGIPMFEHCQETKEAEVPLETKEVVASYDRSEKAEKEDKLAHKRSQAIKRKRHKTWEEKKGLKPGKEVPQEEPEPSVEEPEERKEEALPGDTEAEKEALEKSEEQKEETSEKMADPTALKEVQETRIPDPEEFEGKL